MFVSNSKNNSGTISVRIMEKRRGRNVVIWSFGASSDEERWPRLRNNRSRPRDDTTMCYKEPRDIRHRAPRNCL